MLESHLQIYLAFYFLICQALYCHSEILLIFEHPLSVLIPHASEPARDERS